MPYRIKAEPKNRVFEPEELVNWYERFGEWAVAHIKAIAGAVAVAGLIGLVWGGFWWKAYRAEEQAAVLQIEAFSNYQKALEAGKLQRVPTPETVSGYEQAIVEFRHVIELYPQTTQAAFARYYLGNANAALDRPDQAIAAYQEFLQHPGHGAARQLIPLVIQRLGYAAWAKGQTQDALGYFEQVLKMPTAFNRDQAYFETGRLLEQMGQKDKALDTYNKLATEYASSPWASEGIARITALGGTPPKRSTEQTKPSEPSAPQSPSSAPAASQPSGTTSPKTP